MLRRYLDRMMRTHDDRREKGDPLVRIPSRVSLTDPSEIAPRIGVAFTAALRSVYGNDEKPS